MFVTLELNTEVQLGTVIQYDTIDQSWITATNESYPLGVVKDSNQDTSSGKWLTRVVVAGVAYALAASNIPDQGGFVAVENGRVKLSEVEKYGVIAPRTFGESQREAGSLVMIHLR